MRRIRSSLFACIPLIVTACAADDVATTVRGDLQARDAVESVEAASTLTNAQSGQVVDVFQASKMPGAVVQQWTGWGGANQQWTFQAVGNGTYKVVNVNSGLVLEVAGAAKNSGARVQQWSDNGGPWQHWRLTPGANGAYQIVDSNSGKCLDVPNGSAQNGVALQIWDCWGGAMQQWQVSSPPGGATPGSALRVAGNKLVNASGATVRLRGVNVASLEWSNGEPNAYNSPCWSGQTVLDTVKHAITAWHVNFIRLPVNPDRWQNAVDGQGASYRATIDGIVDYIESQNAYVDVDVHWSDAGQWGKNLGQHLLPDDNTQSALADIAKHFANRRSVLFGVYNEPHDVSWDQWRNGGTINDSGLTYHSPGIQSMVDTVRRAGANNVVIVGGLDWAFDLTGVANGYAINDPSVLYDVHIYPWKGQPSNWDDKVSGAAAQHPILIGEFGADNTQLSGWASPQSFLNTLKPWLDAHQYNYSAWDMHPSASPSVISDFCYTPTPYFGAVVQAWY